MVWGSHGAHGAPWVPLGADPVGARGPNSWQAYLFTDKAPMRDLGVTLSAFCTECRPRLIQLDPGSPRPIVFLLLGPGPQARPVGKDFCREKECF